MGEAEEEMDGVFKDLGVFGARFEVEAAKAGGDSAVAEELGIEVGDEAGGEVCDAEVGVAGALCFSGGGLRKAAGEVAVSVDAITEGELEVAGGFIDPSRLTDGSVLLVHDFSDFVGRGEDDFTEGEMIVR